MSIIAPALKTPICLSRVILPDIYLRATIITPILSKRTFLLA